MNAITASALLNIANADLEVANNMSLTTSGSDMPHQKYSLAEGLSNSEAATRALDYQLYIKDRTLHRALITCKLKDSSSVYLAVDDQNTPVGVAMMVKGLLYIYVTRGLRRQGIGSLILQRMKSRIQVGIGAPGIPGWDSFFKKNGVTCYHVT